MGIFLLWMLVYILLVIQEFEVFPSASLCKTLVLLSHGALLCIKNNCNCEKKCSGLQGLRAKKQEATQLHLLLISL